MDSTVPMYIFSLYEDPIIRRKLHVLAAHWTLIPLHWYDNRDLVEAWTSLRATYPIFIDSLPDPKDPKDPLSEAFFQLFLLKRCVLGPVVSTSEYSAAKWRIASAKVAQCDLDDPSADDQNDLIQPPSTPSPAILTRRYWQVETKLTEVEIAHIRPSYVVGSRKTFETQERANFDLYYHELELLNALRKLTNGRMVVAPKSKGDDGEEWVTEAKLLSQKFLNGEELVIKSPKPAAGRKKGANPGKINKGKTVDHETVKSAGRAGVFGRLNAARQKAEGNSQQALERTRVYEAGSSGFYHSAAERAEQDVQETERKADFGGAGQISYSMSAFERAQEKVEQFKKRMGKQPDL